jgi:hypothetical protein
VEVTRDFSQRRARREIVEGSRHDQSAAWVESGSGAIINESMLRSSCHDHEALLRFAPFVLSYD